MYKKISDHLWELKMEWEYMQDELKYARGYLPELEEDIVNRIFVLEHRIKMTEGVITKILKRGVNHGRIRGKVRF